MCRYSIIVYILCFFLKIYRESYNTQLILISCPINVYCIFNFASKIYILKLKEISLIVKFTN